MRTIATFSKPEEAHLLRTRLESAEIPAWVQDAYAAEIDWMLALVNGGVRVQVDDEDLPDALALLAAERELPPAPSDVFCPVCRSQMTLDDQWRRLALAGLLFFQLPLWPPRERWRCPQCRVSYDRGETKSTSEANPEASG